MREHLRNNAKRNRSLCQTIAGARTGQEDCYPATDLSHKRVTAERGNSGIVGRMRDRHGINDTRPAHGNLTCHGSHGAVPGDGERQGTGRAGQQGDPFLWSDLVARYTAFRERRCGTPHGSVRVDNQSQPEKCAEGVREWNDFSGTPDLGAWDGRYEAVVQALRDIHAERRCDAGIAVQKTGEPSQQHRSSFAPGKERRTTNGPTQEKVCSVLIGLGSG